MSSPSLAPRLRRPARRSIALADRVAIATAPSTAVDGAIPAISVSGAAATGGDPRASPVPAAASRAVLGRLAQEEDLGKRSAPIAKT